MHAIASFVLIVSSSISVLVGAIPQHQPRDDPLCVDQTTITITAPAIADPTTLPEANGQANGADAVTTVTRTVTVLRTIDGLPESSSDVGVTETVTVFTTETSTITVQSPLETVISDPTTEPQGSSSPAAGAPSPTIVRPHFVNASQPVPYNNSSLPSNTSSYGLPNPPILPKPSSSFAFPPSSGYENSLYFTNWLVPLWHFFPLSTQSRHGGSN